MDIKGYVCERVERAKKASRMLASLSTDIKNTALLRMADALEEKEKELIKENEKDICAAKDKGLEQALIDRLTLNSKRIREMSEGMRQVADLPDPVGEIIKLRKRPNGMQVGKMRVPIGVIGIIYESRPNVTADTTALCLKSGNAVVLRGGSEAIHSNSAIVAILSDIGKETGIPHGAVTFIDITDRNAVMEMLRMDQYIDLIIPRGGEGLIRTVTENSTIPVIKHDKGLCHTYIDSHADIDMALAISLNAKAQRPGTCNAMETLLVHQDIADRFLPELAERFKDAGIEIRGCKKTKAIIPYINDAVEDDWNTEYLGLILSVKVVKNMDEALDHIDRYGSFHSEAIVTRDYGEAMRFLNEVDASAVFVNVSTRLNDGFQFGLGAEIGISTTRIHARGPMGLEELTSTKFIILGDGQLRE
ncbi:MAG: glutamate-5-semialdehyde dehydrogenase [Nitrospirota bacterium]